MLEGHLMPDHVHMLIAIPPKLAVSQVMGFIKGKVRFIWHGSMESDGVTLLARVSGRGGISSRRLVGMRR
jgi:REP element-mobilizing transposase RayT